MASKVVQQVQDAPASLGYLAVQGGNFGGGQQGGYGGGGGGGGYGGGMGMGQQQFGGGGGVYEQVRLLLFWPPDTRPVWHLAGCLPMPIAVSGGQAMAITELWEAFWPAPVPQGSIPHVERGYFET